MELKTLERKAVALRGELAEVETAIAVLRRYEPLPDARRSRSGSVKGKIIAILEAKGSAHKREVIAALPGVPVATINAAFAKNRDTFATNGDGTWSLKKG